ncbi:MAG: sulfatase-like hydrolase/transferase [Deltaproteobacteria bacterium]|nr:sulfatase-like hydrolase/transferase [Deltaproteobacteria bacterium]
MKPRFMLNSLGCALIVIAILGGLPALASPVHADASNKGKRNILFITCDQQMFQTVQAEGFRQPALDRLADRGVTFANHYIASAVCTPSRGVIYSGLAPQVTGIQEEMMFGWTPSLPTNAVSIGTAMKQLGYSTAYFGKFELDRDIVYPKPGVNYADALKKYGFDVWQPYGEVTGEKNQGYEVDGVIAAEGIRWLRTNAESLRKGDEPWFLVISLINPHDIFFTDVNPPDESVQKSLNPELISKVPANARYQKQWDFPLWNTLDEPLQAPGRPGAHWEFYRGTAKVMGDIPTERRDMWHAYNNYYMNLLSDKDRCIGQVLDTLDDLDLWKDTVVVFTSDHGELGGSHGGLRNKGPVSYEQNVHVPMIVVHPDVKGGQTTRALTSHIDLLPTLVGLTGAPQEDTADITKGFPGRDFSKVLANPSSAQPDEVRPGILFNFVGLSSVDARFFTSIFEKGFGKDGAFAFTPAELADNHPDLNKRGFLSMTFNGRYKFARYYAPSQFNTPQTMEELLAWNDLELFDLQNDPEERNNLALDPKKNEELILRMNALLNELVAREVGVNDGQFLPPAVRPNGSVCCEGAPTASPR